MTFRRLLLIAALALIPSYAMALTITFGNLNGFARDLGHKTEGPFTYGAVPSAPNPEQWTYISTAGFGNPPSSLHTGVTAPDVGDRFEIYLTLGGLFKLDNFQYASHPFPGPTIPSPTDTARFIGKNNSTESELCNNVNTNSPSWTTHLGCASGPIQRLFIEVTARGPQSLFFDNINLTVVPEPASLLLLAFGLAGLGVARRRRTPRV